MKILDVTLTIHEGMPVWPGDEPVKLERRAKIEEGAHANVSFMSLGAHTGTHVDAPFHFLPNGSKVDQMPLEVLMGPVQVVQVDDSIQVIDAEVISRLAVARDTRRILFKTKNSHFWDSREENFRTDFAGIDLSGSLELLKKGIQLVGIDYLSISPYKISKPTHEALLGAGVVIIEGLDLRQVDAGFYNLICLPMKLKETEGAPARVILTQD